MCELTLFDLFGFGRRVAENSNDRKLQGTEFYSTNLAADIFLPKMVAGLLSHPKRQFFPHENNRQSCFLHYKNSR